MSRTIFGRHRAMMGYTQKLSIAIIHAMIVQFRPLAKASQIVGWPIAEDED